VGYAPVVLPRVAKNTPSLRLLQAIKNHLPIWMRLAEGGNPGLSSAHSDKTGDSSHELPNSMNKLYSIL
jgi:hypothetical protein